MADRTLIFGTSYVHGAASAETFRMWADLTLAANPGADILVIDSASPTPLPVERWTPEFDLVAFPDNVGHLSRGGCDGWGRAFTTGLCSALQGCYDWVVHIECDLLFARPVAETIAKMRRAGVKCAAPMAMPYPFIETALSFWDARYLREIDLADRYDWVNAPANEMPEHRIEEICGPDLFALPLRGFRNDMNIGGDDMRRMFPRGIDWITHAELPVLRAFLEVNGVEHV